MATYNVTLGKRSGETKVIAVDWEKMPDTAKEKIIAYGVQRVFNDMVGGSDSTLEDKVKDVEAAVARFYAGDIGRKAAEGVSAEVSIGRSLVRQALKAKYGAKSPEWATFTGLSDGSVVSWYDHTRWAVGEVVRPHAWDPRRDVRCSSGIHVFLTREEAEVYML